VDPDPVEVERFLAMEASGWKGEAGTALAADPAHAAFFAELCRRLGRGGGLELSVLRCAGRTLAMTVVLIGRTARYAFKVAIDEDFRKQAPGTHLIVHVTENPPPGAPLPLDSCADPDNELLNGLLPDRRELVSLALARPGARAGVRRTALRVAGGRLAASDPAERSAATG
jgi:hypothetical protein